MKTGQRGGDMNKMQCNNHGIMKAKILGLLEKNSNKQRSIRKNYRKNTKEKFTD
jgi:hypothetical protein